MQKEGSAKKMIDCTNVTNYIAEKVRMTKRQKVEVCKFRCTDCPLSDTNNGVGVPCSDLEAFYPEKAISIVQEWSNAHPQKTFLTELLEKYPKVSLGDHGIPKWVCPHDLGLMNKDDCRKYHNCAECWNQPITE